eukprot:scaffold751_cov395-Prasinococcus_capsulatus_cf.AAC.19
MSAPTSGHREDGLARCQEGWQCYRTEAGAALLAGAGAGKPSPCSTMALYRTGSPGICTNPFARVVQPFSYTNRPK